MNISLIPKVQR
jgi:hypothetical protein